MDVFTGISCLMVGPPLTKCFVNVGLFVLSKASSVAYVFCRAINVIRRERTSPKSSIYSFPVPVSWDMTQV